MADQKCETVISEIKKKWCLTHVRSYAICDDRKQILQKVEVLVDNEIKEWGSEEDTPDWFIAFTKKLREVLK